MKRLYRIEATAIVYLIADDAIDARDAAMDAISAEIRANGDDVISGSPVVREIHELSGVDPRWRNAPPLNQGDEETYLSCAEFLNREDD